ncbi:PqqD family peptide modification chaperone [Halomonas daqiaonensis]|uniref:Coenzyme PQQ synthesis protein D (PqqD) n=1 Tax=Halomonas daqiaonensis TaxID=650850 RepID=A0A1H7HFR3_9GAMM|nr:PqqD family peptide modification chaperone [Halomonas daqiaonensis]SEK49216.1 Coenzyme PQQ synthesis protein D (PqqD) [Halomonas daqiaonensis]
MSNPLLENTALLVRTPNLIAADLDGELVMMDAQAGCYYGISGVGTRAFELLETPISIDGLVEIITHEYEVGPETCRREMQAFVQALMENGLVRPVSQ